MVVDSFIFFNELDLLEIRLNVLDSVVDRFVIVESPLTFQGKAKPLHFFENRLRFEKFKHKIVHIVADVPPRGWLKTTPWTREYFQRNQIEKGWLGCGDDDIIILSDLDEIPNPDLIRSLSVNDSFKIFKLQNYYHFINCRCIDPLETWWHGPIAFAYKNRDKPQSLRGVVARMNRNEKKGLKDKWQVLLQLMGLARKNNRVEVVENGGWHFGFLGGVDKIIEKIESFAHSEFNTPRYKDPDAIKAAIMEGADLFGRPMKYQFTEIDNTYPRYIVENKERLRHLIKGV